MPSRALNADRSAITRLHTHLDVEGIAVARGETTLPAAVARLVRLVPPTRLDLVDEVNYRVGLRRRDRKSWPDFGLLCKLAFEVKRVHAGEMRLRGPAGEVVDLVNYVDTGGRHRRVFRLHIDGVYVGEYGTPEELGRRVDLATLVEEEPDAPEIPGQLF